MCFVQAIAGQSRLESLLVDRVFVGLRLADREQDFTEQQEVLRHLGNQIPIDGIEQANTGERFDTAKRCAVDVDVDDPNMTMAVNEFLHGGCVPWFGRSALGIES
jgi:hypothetical protein